MLSSYDGAEGGEKQEKLRWLGRMEMQLVSEDREPACSSRIQTRGGMRPKERQLGGRQRGRDEQRFRSLFGDSFLNHCWSPSEKAPSHQGCPGHTGPTAGYPCPSLVRVAASPVPGPSVNSSPWLKRTDGARRGASPRDSEAEELPIPVRAACNVWLNFLSN